MACSKVKQLCCGAEAKASLNWANLVACHRPETWRATYGQAETRVTPCGGPNALLLKK